MLLLVLGGLLGCSAGGESALGAGEALRARFPEQVKEVLEAGTGFVATGEGFVGRPREALPGGFRPAGEKHLLDRVGKLEPDVALRITAQVCLGLQKAHEARVMHRDIKPANLFLARRAEGEIETAKPRAAGPPSATATSAKAATAQPISPKTTSSGNSLIPEKFK